MRYFRCLLVSLFVLVSACADDAGSNSLSDLDGGSLDSAKNVTSNNATSNNATSNNATSNNATSNNATTGNSDTGLDAGSDAGPNDAGTDDAGTGDDGGMTDDAGMNDAGTDDAGMSDAGTEMDMGDPWAGRPVGQCVTADDCPANPNGKVCNKFLPGGACGACGNNTTCDDECFVGTCITTCGTDDDCPPGLECTGVGRCGAIRCVNDVCPVPLFGCSGSGLCARVDCSNGEACPTGTTCTNGVCAEDRALP